jgi:vitamin B12 transporter
VLVFGGSAARSTVETSTNSVSMWGPFTQSLDAAANDYALYTNLQARLSERIDVTAGLRYDVPDDYDNTLTYRIGAVVAVPEILTRFSGAVGTVYKAPTLYDRFGVDNYGYRGNTNLSPEESFSWEVGFETDLPAFGRSKVVSFGATYFKTKTDDLITNDFALQTVVNIGEASSEGVESFIALRPADWIETRLNYTWMQARNEDTGQMLLRRPRHQGSLAVDLQPTRDVSFGPELVYVGSRLDVAYDDNGGFLGNRRSGSYTLVNLAGSYRLREDVSLFGKVYNLFDRDYEPSNGFAGRGLTALVGVRGSF